MSLNLAQWIAKLTSDEYNQSHLVADVESWSEEQKDAFVCDLNSCETSYPGGILNYLVRARKMLKESASGFNPFEGFTPEVPTTIKLEPGSEAFDQSEVVGLDHLHEMTYVLVAGGLGERLGYPGIKVSLPTEVLTMKSYLQYYAEYILALDAVSSERRGTKVVSPLAILTSDDTYTDTVKLLEGNSFFGLGKDRVVIMKQEKVPAVFDSEARIAQQEDSKQLQLKPHGHGDVHQLLIQHDLPNKWVKEGKKYMLFFQDTNALVFRILCATLGVAVQKELVMNTICIPRKAQEAVGGICRLTKKETAEEITINVEYNQLGPMLAASGYGGDVADKTTGNSLFPGNTNALLFHLPRYAEVMAESGGNIPEFVNPKYKDDTKTAFKSPTRLECMMQEYPRLLGAKDKVGCVETERFICFSTVKNHHTDAIAKVASGNTAECAFSAEADLYDSNCRLLTLAAQKAGAKVVEIATPVQKEYLGVKYDMGPRVSLAPSFGVCLHEMAKNIQQGSSLVLHQDSSLIVEGKRLLPAVLDVQGAVQVSASTTTTTTTASSSSGGSVVVRNKGIVFDIVKEEDVSVPLPLSIRGYQARKVDVHTV